MSQQTIRQAARRAALDGQAQRRRQRAERDKRIEALAVDFLTALEERKAAISDCERRAGLALLQMTQAEGLSEGDVVQRCGDGLTNRELRRLARLADREAVAAPAAPESAGVVDLTVADDG